MFLRERYTDESFVAVLNQIPHDKFINFLIIHKAFLEKVKNISLINEIIIKALKVSNKKTNLDAEAIRDNSVNVRSLISIFELQLKKIFKIEHLIELLEALDLHYSYDIDHLKQCRLGFAVHLLHLIPNGNELVRVLPHLHDEERVLYIQRVEQSWKTEYQNHCSMLFLHGSFRKGDTPHNFFFTKGESDIRKKILQMADLLPSESDQKQYNWSRS